MATHTFDPDNPHAAPGNAAAAGSATVPPASGAALAEYQAAMDTMHSPMVAGFQDPDPDVAFVRSMIPHHQGAIDMARIQLKYGTDPENRALAQHIIAEQELEIRQMEQWLKTHGAAAGDGS
ncbi:MAG: DUF305 domain-containing protein [Acetobacteraceae bacterium]|nr:MAG: DUF305 domain-containing protein [Acetobacteraceae bacterium]